MINVHKVVAFLVGVFVRVTIKARIPVCSNVGKRVPEFP